MRGGKWQECVGGTGTLLVLATGGRCCVGKGVGGERAGWSGRGASCTPVYGSTSRAVALWYGSLEREEEDASGVRRQGEKAVARCNSKTRGLSQRSMVLLTVPTLHACVHIPRLHSVGSPGLVPRTPITPPANLCPVLPPRCTPTRWLPPLDSGPGPLDPRPQGLPLQASSQMHSL